MIKTSRHHTGKQKQSESTEQNNPKIMSIPSKKQQTLVLVSSLLICYLVAFIGATASINAKSFYSELSRPGWSPPGWLFGPVWFCLYSMMAIAAWLVWTQEGFRAHQDKLLLYLVHLIPNALWSWLFFHWHLGAISFLVIILLWTMILITVLMFWKVKPIAGILLLPYLVWVTFATALNLALWQMNPGLLS